MCIRDRIRSREEVLAKVKAATEGKVNETCDGESRLTELMESVRMAATQVSKPDQLTSYFSDRIVPKLRSSQQLRGINHFRN